MNPYFIDEPAAISFSGGRTSAYMLYRILEAHGGTLPDDVQVTFGNTGKEMDETLDFVQACSDNWNVDIVWLEYNGGLKADRPKIVTHETASRNGEPFAQLIKAKSYCPNMVARFCTEALKVTPIIKHMGGDFLTVVGIRADEPRRVAKMRAKENYATPLADDGIGQREVLEFWANQPFDLDLPLHGNLLSNCDLCFLKGYSIKQSIVEHEPNRADWWAEQEKLVGASFRSDQPSYAEMKIIATTQQGFDFADDESISCFCGD